MQVKSKKGEVKLKVIKHGTDCVFFIISVILSQRRLKSVLKSLTK